MFSVIFLLIFTCLVSKFSLNAAALSREQLIEQAYSKSVTKLTKDPARLAQAEKLKSEADGQRKIDLESKIRNHPQIDQTSVRGACGRLLSYSDCSLTVTSEGRSSWTETFFAEISWAALYTINEQRKLVVHTDAMLFLFREKNDGSYELQGKMRIPFNGGDAAYELLAVEEGVLLAYLCGGELFVYNLKSGRKEGPSLEFPTKEILFRADGQYIACVDKKELCFFIYTSEEWYIANFRAYKAFASSEKPKKHVRFEEAGGDPGSPVHAALASAPNGAPNKDISLMSKDAVTLPSPARPETKSPILSSGVGIPKISESVPVI